MRVSFNLEITGGPSPPSADSFGSRLQTNKLFSLYRFVTFALVLGLSIALIPLSIAQREHLGGWWGYRRSKEARLSYVCGLSVTSLLFTLIAVLSDFVLFPSSAPLWVEFGLSWAFSIMWMTCAILALEVRDANSVLAFIVFGCVMAYSLVLSGKALCAIARGDQPWNRAVHLMVEKGVKLGDEEADALLHRSSVDTDQMAPAPQPAPVVPAGASV